VVEALDDGLDGSLGHQRGVLADGGEIDEGQPGISLSSYPTTDISTGTSMRAR
jgi:hypothetical protein